MKRYHIIVSGKVQGVGFRYFVLMTCNTLKLTGTVRNSLDGSVEIYAQGKESHLLTLKNTLLKGNGFSEVDDIVSNEAPIVYNEKNFKLIY